MLIKLIFIIVIMDLNIQVICFMLEIKTIIKIKGDNREKKK